MGLLTRLKSVALSLRPGLQPGDVTVRPPDAWIAARQMSDAGEAVTDAAVMGVSTVWACVRLLAGTTASLPLAVHRQVGGRREVASDHPVHRLIHVSPNYDQTSIDFWEYQSAALELWGNAYADIRRVDGRATSLVPVAPHLVTVRRLRSGSLEYRWTEDGDQRVRLDGDVLHIRGFGGSPLGGMSTLTFGRHAFGLARAADRAAASVFRNGLRPSGALTFEQFLSEENRRVAEEKLAEKYVGAVNTGRPLILEGGAKWVPLTINPDDAQMLETRRFSVEEVCRFYGVPPHMVGHTDKSTSWGTGIEQQTLGFVKFTLRPRLKRIEQAVEKQLLTPAERASGLSVEFNMEGLLRGDSANRASFYQTMTAIGAMTINEVRALESLPAVAGGDEPRTQMQNVPITEPSHARDD